MTEQADLVPVVKSLMFKDDDDVAEFVVEWFCAQPKAFYLSSSIKLLLR